MVDATTLCRISRIRLYRCNRNGSQDTGTKYHQKPQFALTIHLQVQDDRDWQEKNDEICCNVEPANHKFHHAIVEAFEFPGVCEGVPHLLNRVAVESFDKEEYHAV